jgi:hypothetical protein
MSWNVSGLVIQLETPESAYGEFLEKLGLADPEFEETLSFDDAMDESSEGSVAIASVDGWTSVWGRMLVFCDDVLGELTGSANAFVFLLEGVSGSYLFEWWTGGSRRRKWFSQGGSIQIDEGTPLPEEQKVRAEAPDDEEDQIFLLMNELTLPYRRLTGPEFDVFSISER